MGATATFAPAVSEWVYTRPWMYPKQEQAFFGTERYSIVEASTKAGKTVACMCWLTEQAMRATTPNRNYWWVAPVTAQAKIAFRRLKYGLPREIYMANESELTITLLNGSRIWFKGSDKPDSLFGEDVFAACIDEASRCKEESWYAVRSTLTQTRGPIRIIGNVKGKLNWAYDLARRAEAGEPNMRYTKITALDAVAAGVLDAQEIEDARHQLPEGVFNELYLCIPDTAGAHAYDPDWWRGINRFNPDVGFLTDTAIQRFISWDTAFKDKDTSAYSAAVVFDVLPTYQVVVRHVWRGKLTFPDLPPRIEAVAAQWNLDGKLRKVVIEDRASGISANQTLAKTAPPWLSRMIVPFAPPGSKEERARQSAVWCKQGAVLLPEPSMMVPWLADFEEEIFHFPETQYMDQTDAFSQGLLYLENYLAAYYRKQVKAGVPETVRAA